MLPQKWLHRRPCLQTVDRIALLFSSNSRAAPGNIKASFFFWTFGKPKVTKQKIFSKVEQSFPDPLPRSRHFAFYGKDFKVSATTTSTNSSELFGKMFLREINRRMDEWVVPKGEVDRYFSPGCIPTTSAMIWRELQNLLWFKVWGYTEFIASSSEQEWNWTTFHWFR